VTPSFPIAARSGIAMAVRNRWAALINWLPLLAVAGPLLASCAEQPKQSYLGQGGPADELAARAECHGEAAKAPVAEAAPADVRAEVAQGIWRVAWRKRAFISSNPSAAARHRTGAGWLAATSLRISEAARRRSEGGAFAHSVGVVTLIYGFRDRRT